MKVHLSSRPANDASAAVGAWRQVVRSPAFVGLFLAVLILLLAWPRLTGPPWQTFQMPFNLRESEGNTLVWEHIILYNAFRATLQADAAPAIKRGYDTNQYRALLPTYISAIFAYWLDSSYKGFALVDLLGWWIAVWVLYYLARFLDIDKLSALTAAVLLAASPLLISKMWGHGLNTVHHSSLVLYFFAALLLFSDRNLGFIRRILALSIVFYLASLTYHYQWIIAPCLISIVALDKGSWKQFLSIVIASALFCGMTLLTYRLLGSVGIPVQPSLNDPLAVVNGRLTSVVEDGVIGFGYSLGLFKLLVKAYHPFIIALSVLGLIFARTRLRILVFAGAVLGLATSYFQPLPWVAMNGYPFMYISAGIALVQGPRWLADFIARVGSGRYPQFAERITSVSRTLAVISTVVLILLAVWSTNTDLFGYYGFAQQWWDFTYVPT